MDKAKSMIDKKGHCYTNGLQRDLHAQVNNGICSAYSSSANCSGDSSNIVSENLHPDDDQLNGSPAKRCRLRRRVESLKRNRPRKGILSNMWLCLYIDMISFVEWQFIFANHTVPTAKKIAASLHASPCFSHCSIRNEAYVWRMYSS